MICFDKHSIDFNVPSNKTIISKNHCIFYKGELLKAYKFVDLFDNVYEINYNGQILYNVLMDEHLLIYVNNLICETLYPGHYISILYKKISNLSPYKKKLVIKYFNKYIYKTLIDNNYIL